MWVYAAIRPRFGPGVRTAGYAGLVMSVGVLSAVTLGLCRGRDLNPQGRYARGILSPLCLPISPPRRTHVTAIAYIVSGPQPGDTSVAVPVTDQRRQGSVGVPHLTCPLRAAGRDHRRHRADPEEGFRVEEPLVRTVDHRRRAMAISIMRSSSRGHTPSHTSSIITPARTAPAAAGIRPEGLSAFACSGGLAAIAAMTRR